MTYLQFMTWNVKNLNVKYLFIHKQIIKIYLNIYYIFPFSRSCNLDNKKFLTVSLERSHTDLGTLSTPQLRVEVNFSLFSFAHYCQKFFSFFICRAPVDTSKVLKGPRCYNIDDLA